jgi:Fe-Mn family superoxide dismutase
MEKFKLPDLPYASDALKPHFSAKQFEYHHGKHHAGYVKNLNNLIAGTEFEDRTLEQIVSTAFGTIYNNAAQHWNHSFFWKCMSPNGGKPTDPLATTIDKTWNGYDDFKQDLISRCLKFFGSGWLWLAYNTQNGQIQLVETNNAGTLCPARSIKYTPIFVVDLWEHAFYVDHPADKEAYIKAFWNVLDWDFANKNFELARE